LTNERVDAQLIRLSSFRQKERKIERERERERERKNVGMRK
jgi:hypothetical protein